MPVKSLQPVVVLCTCLLWGASSVTAQRVSPTRWEFGASVGIFMYQGDLTPSVIGGYKDPKLGLNLFASRIMSSSLALRGQLSLSALKTNEADYNNPAWRQQRNLAFVSPLAEVSALAVWYPKADLMDAPYLKNISPYLFAGAALSFLSVRRDFSRFNGDFFNTQPKVINGLALDALHRTPKLTPVIPVGAGAKYPVSEKFSLFAEASYRLGFNDYIDGVSKAGNPRKKDHYYSVSIGLTYRPFRNRGIGCPSVQ
jgi:hypothetical protein